MSDLKNRVRYTNSIDIVLLNQFKTLAEITRIPQSKLLDEAIKLILKKYDFKVY